MSRRSRRPAAPPFRFGRALAARLTPFAMAWAAAAPLTAQSSAHFDLLVRGGHIVDGTGNPWFRGDVGVRDGAIVAVGRLDGATADRVLDATGRIVAPGFIDIHSPFPRKIAWYARDRAVLGVEDAVRSMTSLPALLMGFRDRGQIREGFRADLVVFDLDELEDRTTFFEPHAYPSGIEHVLVGGEAVVDGGRLTWALPGQVLTGPGLRRPVEPEPFL